MAALIGAPCLGLGLGSKASSSLQQKFGLKQRVHCQSVVSRTGVTMKADGKFIVGGNWKCNGSVDEIKALVADLNKGDIPYDIDVVVSPPFVYLPLVQSLIQAPYKVAAQNCWTGKGGAFTGEVSADMLVDLMVPWVIIGHSERRSLCGESNEVVGTKVSYALGKGLKVIACIGETLAQRESGAMFNVLDAQLQAIADNVTDWKKVVLAYEPVWAIGTGVVATPDQAQEVHAYLRKWLANKVSPEVARIVRIQYGGSVNDQNCVELAKKEDIDGFLVGGASLKGSSFVTICNSQKQAALT